jgi:outer membrane protein assembly factor BamE (lipoprotein component of BamABCDE complex)
MTIARRTALLALLFSLSGCITRMPTHSGRPIDTEYVKSIEKGKTTMDDVRLKLGEPMSVTQSTSEVVWTYQHWEGKPAMLGTGYSKSETTFLTVRFQKGKLVDYSLSTAGR